MKRIERDRARFTVSHLVDAIRRGSPTISAEPCPLTIKNVVRNIAIPVVVMHRDISLEGTATYTVLSGESHLSALAEEAGRIRDGRSTLSLDPPEGGSRLDSEVDRFWLYTFDIEMLGGTLEEAKAIAKEIEEAWRD